MGQLQVTPELQGSPPAHHGDPPYRAAAASPSPPSPSVAAARTRNSLLCRQRAKRQRERRLRLGRRRCHYLLRVGAQAAAAVDEVVQRPVVGQHVWRRAAAEGHPALQPGGDLAFSRRGGAPCDCSAACAAGPCSATAFADGARAMAAPPARASLPNPPATCSPPTALDHARPHRLLAVGHAPQLRVGPPG